MGKRYRFKKATGNFVQIVNVNSETHWISIFQSFAAMYNTHAHRYSLRICLLVMPCEHDRCASNAHSIRFASDAHHNELHVKAPLYAVSWGSYKGYYYQVGDQSQRTGEKMRLICHHPRLHAGIARMPQVHEKLQDKSPLHSRSGRRETTCC